MATIFEVEVRDINVDDRYFDFQYSIKRDGKIISEGEIQDEHSWGDNEADKASFLKMLEEGHAVDLAMEKVIQQ